MVLKVPQQCNYKILIEYKTLKDWAWKEFELLKIFILHKICFSDAETHFWQPKILKISNLKKFTCNGFKTCPNEKQSCFDKRKEIKTFGFKKILQVWKIFTEKWKFNFI